MYLYWSWWIYTESMCRKVKNRLESLKSDISGVPTQSLQKLMNLFHFDVVSQVAA